MLPTPPPALAFQGGTAVSSTTPQAPATTVSPSAIYEGLRNQRQVLGEQLRGLERTRGDLVRQLRRGGVGDSDRTGLESRLAQVDQQIAALSITIREVDAQVATAAAVPGAVVPPPPPPRRRGPEPELVAIGLAFTALLLFPLVIAQARRIWRRQSVTVGPTSELGERLAAMERAIDAVAIEVERVGEGQRFLNRVLAERGSARAEERIGHTER